MSLLLESEILELIRQGHRWIDVRAPIEFESGTIPNSINLPIMSNEERHLVGTCFKQHGREKAIELGHQLVSGANKEQKRQAWIQEIKKYPSLSLYCFRGGLRSQISQQWLKDSGVSVQRVPGGYKKMRNLMMDHFRERLTQTPMRLISGPTGSWKTHLLSWIEGQQGLAIDLEKHASHRGSAFGKQGSQPAQVNFEHAIVKKALDAASLFEKKRDLYLEDESRLIGRCVLPEFLFAKMREAPLLWIDESIEVRVENIFKDYILETDIVLSSDVDRIQAVYQRYLTALSEIKKRLGHERFSEIYIDIQAAQVQSLSNGDPNSNRIWIRKLLVSYYDPLYFGSLERRNPTVLIKAKTSEIKDFILSSLTK